MKRKRKYNGAVVFFIVMAVVYLLFFLIDANYTKGAFAGFIEILKKITPIIIGVYLLMFFINIFLKPEKINKHLGKESGIKGWVYTTLSGILIPSPPYIVFPLLGELKKHGMKDSLIVAFLYNRNLQISFLPVLAYYFGIPFMIVVSCYIFIFAIISGIFIEKLLNKKIIS